MHLDSFVDSLLWLLDFKSKFYDILIHNMTAFLNQTKKKCVSRKLFGSPKQIPFSGIFQGA